MEYRERQKIRDILASTAYGSEILVKGWVCTKRGNKNVAFLALNDGSIIHNLQIVVDVANFDDFSNGITTFQCMYAPEFNAHSEGVRVRVIE